MKSPFYFIVEPIGAKDYDSVRESGLIVSVSKEDHKATNRFARVISTPIQYDGPIQEGDTIVVHHNIFRTYYDMKGRERKSLSWLKDNLYIVADDQFFLYRKDNQEWMAPSPYCFVAPVSKQHNLSVHELGQEEPLIGTLEFVNCKTDIPVGSTVSFQPNSEYAFYIDGKKLYRMFDKNICIILDGQQEN